MKIFISHSSKDKWAARRISEDLENLGANTFLDEKDIRTGESIDNSIKKNLKNCDDFLFLLSPSSLKSEWVLVELGGALALEKKIIPILLYVGANEIPSMISLKLARDINDIDRYYNEVKSVLDGTQKPKSKKSTSKLKIGDKVKISETRPNDIYKAHGLIYDWEGSMDYSLGVITKIVKDYGDGSYVLELDENMGYEAKIYAEEWLTKIN